MTNTPTFDCQRFRVPRDGSIEMPDAAVSDEDGLNAVDLEASTGSGER